MKATKEDAFLLSRLYRFLGNTVAKPLVSIPITPNHVTILGLIVGLLAGSLILLQEPLYLVAAALLLQLNVILDFADGSLAHLTQTESKLGHWLDHNSGLPVDIFVFFAIGMTVHKTHPGATVWILTYLCLSWRLLIKNIYMTLISTNLLTTQIENSGKNIFVKLLRECVPTRYLILLMTSVALLANQLYLFLIFFSIYGALTYLGLFVISYCMIYKAEKS